MREELRDARGEQTASSGLDVALVPEEDGFIGYAETEAFRSAVENVLGIGCDVLVGLDGETPSFARSFQRDARLVYGRDRAGRVKSR